jgi:hypothetical protein
VVPDRVRALGERASHQVQRPVARRAPAGRPVQQRAGALVTQSRRGVNAAVAGGSIRSYRSRASAFSHRSFGSVGSSWSLFSAGSLLSVGSVGSILSIGSAGSVLSIGSSGSILSIGAAGGFLSFRGGRDASPVDETDEPATRSRPRLIS